MNLSPAISTAIAGVHHVVSWFPLLLWHGATQVLTWISRVLLLMALFLVLTYRQGWLHRCLWYLLEHEISKLLNGTVVTVGHFSVDWVHGHVRMSNVIIHAPQRGTWHWQSPVLARLGTVHVQSNVLHCIAALWLMGEKIPLDIQTVHCCDIQVFVERQDHMFNFYLLDPHVVLPPPPTATKDHPHPNPSESATSRNQSRDALQRQRGSLVQGSALHSNNSHPSSRVQNLGEFASDAESSILVEDRNMETASSVVQCHGVPEITPSSSTTDGNNFTSTGNDLDASTSSAVDSLEINHPTGLHPSTTTTAGIATAPDPPPPMVEPQPHETAQQLVDDMVRAIGRAAKDGNWQTALQQHSETLAGQLRAMQKQAKTSRQVMQESVALVQHLSQAVVMKTQHVHQVVLPERRRLPQDSRPVYARVGRVVLQDLRIFTRDRWDDDVQQQQQQQQQQSQAESHQQQPVQSTELDGANMTRATSSRDMEQRPTHNEMGTAASDIADEGGLSSSTMAGHPATAPTDATSSWNKPIVLQRLTVRASELCPPFSAKDQIDSRLPALYQPMEKYVDVISARIVAEMAKSNTGRFLQAAMNEVLVSPSWRNGSINSGDHNASNHNNNNHNLGSVGVGDTSTMTTMSKFKQPTQQQQQHPRTFPSAVNPPPPAAPGVISTTPQISNRSRHTMQGTAPGAEST